MENRLWDIDTEKDFFTSSLNAFATPAQLFYDLKGKKYAYIPKKFDSEGQTLQSRNSLIGHYTEKWVCQLLKPIARKFGLYAVNNVVCDEVGLSRQSDADVAFCTTENRLQQAANIKLIFEVKMSIVWNYLFENNALVEIGDYKTHKGNPSLLRSDSMLKAIGKSVNIRVSGEKSKRIPIIILGNSPITSNYSGKVDFLKESGIIQQFISLNPSPTTGNCIHITPKNGFVTANSLSKLEKFIGSVLTKELYFFSAMNSLVDIGKFIEIANKEELFEDKAKKFLLMIKG